MAWFGPSEYHCPECDGDGTVWDTCECCDHEEEHDCELCKRTGFDPDKVDVDAYKAAHDAVSEQVRQAGGGSVSCAWIVDGVHVGRDCFSRGKIDVRDYLLTTAVGT